MHSILKSAFAAVVIVSATGASSATLIHQYDFTSGAIDLVGTQNGTLVGDANITGGTLNLDGKSY